MKNLDTIAEQLFNEIRGRFPSIELGDAEGNITNEPKQARFYDFDFQSNGKKLGKVSVSLDEDDGIVVMYSKDFVESEFGSIKTDWYGFLKNLRTFTKKRLLNFEVRDINRSNLTKRDYNFLASNRSGEQTMAESRMYGNAKTSFQKIGGAKLSIKHTGAIEEGGSRTSKIGAIFIENSEGEKFKYPYKHLSGARALALHVSEGGNPYDEFGKYITGLSEELSNLRKFKTYMGRSSVMAESLAEHMGTVNERMIAVKKEIQNLQKPSYYAEAFEQYVPLEETEVPSEVAENWIDQLTVKQFNEELKDVFPYIYSLVSENAKTQELQFEDIISEQVDYRTYEVQPGDTLSGIVADMNEEGIETTIDQVRYDNAKAIGANDLIKPGQILKIREPVNIGSTPGNPATRGIDPAQNYSAADLARLTGQPGYSEAIDHAIDSLMGQFAENLDEAHMKGYDKYHCKDCGCQMHNCRPDCDCPHDSHDESGDWWVDKDGNGVPDKFEGNAFAHAVRKAKMDGKKKGDKIDHPDPDEDDIVIEKDKTPLGEFILSYFDRETGQFPKGPTAVLTMVEKQYGEQYVRPAAKFIERIDAKVAEVMGYRDETEVDESGILYRAGVKKYGKKGMKAIQSAAGSGASQEEIGRIKDKYNPKTESDDIRRLAGLI
jgi:LysM repeat protein